MYSCSFSFDACFVMGTVEERTRTGLVLNYTIEERLYQDQPVPRVHFNQDSERSPKVARRIIIRPQDIGKHRCERETAYLRVSGGIWACSLIERRILLYCYVYILD